MPVVRLAQGQCIIGKLPRQGGCRDDIFQRSSSTFDDHPSGGIVQAGHAVCLSPIAAKTQRLLQRRMRISKGFEDKSVFQAKHAPKPSQGSYHLDTPVFEPPLPFDARRHLSEQYLTCFQSRAHFFRHVKGRSQTWQILVGSSPFFRIFIDRPISRILWDACGYSQ